MKNTLLNILRSEAVSAKNLANRLQEYYGIKLKDLPKVQSGPESTVPPEALAWLCLAHEELKERRGHRPQVVSKWKPGLRDEAAALIGMMDGQAFQEFLQTLIGWAFQSQSSNRKMYLAYPVCRYADENTMQVACDQMRQWAMTDWGTDLAPKKVFTQAAMYSRTKAAIGFLYEQGVLKAYAELWNLNEAFLRDRIESNCSQRLLEDFLSSREWTAEEWRSALHDNPALCAATEGLVWSQGDASFVVADDRLVDQNDGEYVLTDKAVKIAHPMEMLPESLKNWRQRFAVKNFEQPFCQLWEPVKNEKQVLPDRYTGRVLPIQRFADMEAHGIHGYGVKGISTHYGFSLEGCGLSYRQSNPQINFDGTNYATFILGEFHFPYFSRQVNHIVSLLDYWIAEKQIEEDDITIVPLINGFTIVQMTELIRKASEVGAVKVLAALLEYKNAHFADYEPIEEFTLE